MWFNKLPKKGDQSTLLKKKKKRTKKTQGTQNAKTEGYERGVWHALGEFEIRVRLNKSNYFALTSFSDPSHLIFVFGFGYDKWKKKVTKLSRTIES